MYIYIFIILPKLNYSILKHYRHSAIQNWVKSHVTFLYTIFWECTYITVPNVLSKYFIFMCYVLCLHHIYNLKFTK